MIALLTAATIAAAVAVGVWAERRRPQAAARAARRSLTLMLYVLTRPVALALGARLALAPALLMLLAAPLIDLPTAYRLMAAMPSGINSMVVAHAYGLDMEITAEAVTWSTAIVVLAALCSLLL